MYEAPLGEPRDPVCRVPKPDATGQQRLFEIQFLTEGQDLYSAEIKPGSILDPKGQGQLIWQIDEILILKLSAFDFRSQTVIATDGVGTGIMDMIGAAFRARAAAGEITVAQSAQSFAQALLQRIEAFVDKGVSTHVDHSCNNAVNLSRKRRTSCGSRR